MTTSHFESQSNSPVIVGYFDAETRRSKWAYYDAKLHPWAVTLVYNQINQCQSEKIPLTPCVFHSGEQPKFIQLKAYNAAYAAVIDTEIKKQLEEKILQRIKFYVNSRINGTFVDEKFIRESNFPDINDEFIQQAIKDKLVKNPDSIVDDAFKSNAVEQKFISNIRFKIVSEKFIADPKYHHVYDQIVKDSNSDKILQLADANGREAMYTASFNTQGIIDCNVWFQNYECYDTCSYHIKKNFKTRQQKREKAVQFLDGCVQMTEPLKEMYRNFNTHKNLITNLKITIGNNEVELRNKTKGVNKSDPTYMAREQMMERSEAILLKQIETAEVNWVHKIEYERTSAHEQYQHAISNSKQRIREEAIENGQDPDVAVANAKFAPFVFEDDNRASKDGYIIRATADESAEAKRRRTDFENWINKNTHNESDISALRELYIKNKSTLTSLLIENSKMAVNIYVRCRYLFDNIKKSLSNIEGKLKTQVDLNKYKDYGVDKYLTLLERYINEMLPNIIDVNIETSYLMFTRNEAAAYKRLIEQKVGGTRVVEDIIPVSGRMIMNEDGTFEIMNVELTEEERTIGNRIAPVTAPKIDEFKEMADEYVNFGDYYNEDDYDEEERLIAFNSSRRGLAKDTRIGTISKEDRKAAKPKARGPPKPQVRISRNNHR
jgi:hypothetical protein